MSGFGFGLNATTGVLGNLVNHGSKKYNIRRVDSCRLPRQTTRARNRPTHYNVARFPS